MTVVQFHHARERAGKVTDDALYLVSPIRFTFIIENLADEDSAHVASLPLASAVEARALAPAEEDAKEYLLGF